MSKPDFVWHRGYLAGEAGRRPEENPYAQRDSRVDEHKAGLWEDGRAAGERQFLSDVEEMGKSTPFDQVVFFGAICAMMVGGCGIVAVVIWIFS